MIQLTPGRTHEQLQRLTQRMDQMVVGQPKAIHRITDSLSRLVAGIHDPERPLLTMMFLGPTGVGKTETVCCLSEAVFGNRRAFTRIDCQEYSAHYNISKLLGSPPGYVGGEIRPLLSQENLERHHKQALTDRSGMICEAGSKLSSLFPPESERHLSIVLFDEIEKAHPKMWNTLLGIIEDGRLVLANNEEVDFTDSIIILTTNVGSKVMNEHLANNRIGFSTGFDANLVDHEIEDAVMREAKKIFPMEFLNRFDDLVTYGTLREKHLFQILDNLISRIHHRSLRCSEPFLLEVSRSAKEALVRTGTDPEYGARPLKRVVEKEIVTPVAHYICSEQIRRGDLVMIDYRDGEFVFLNEASHAWEDSPLPSGALPPAEGRWARTDLGVKDDGGAKKKIEAEVEKVVAVADSLGGAGFE